MTTLAVSGIQAVASGGVRALTSLAVSTATSAITRAFDNRVFEGPRLESFKLQTSRDGAPMPRIFGRVRLAGQVIWASQVRETVSEESVGGKGGGPVQRNYSYSISFAVGLCEGEILGVDRIWANGKVLRRSGLTIRVHTGAETQGPDPVIAATEPGDVPAFRGTAYVVFEDFPLDGYGGRLPSINAEVVRAVRRGGRLESLVRSVNLLPGTGEFALSPTVVEELPSVGVSIPSNMNSFSGEADLITSLDQLQSELRNCRHVSIISAWFGTSLDAGACAVRPGVEKRKRILPDVRWSVAGKDRSTAYIVSTDEQGRPNYGGTPDDASLIACIRELKQRGFAVTLYPFLLMDMPGFPWRGRIRANSAADVSAFFGTDHDDRFRHHILHHARIAQQAGGVDAIIIGSELKALMATRIEESFPAVAAMRALAGSVRAVVGSNTKITYAADWSDYFGVQDGGDVRYHLDPLWADDDIDAVGIDAYFPLSDWRDGNDHTDAAPGRRAHDLDYLRGNVEGGEGYDWYYANGADRDAQTRTPIHEPVYRYKDLRHWWSQPHVERRGGLPAGQSAWVPRSKPIWLLEVGCPAVDKGANQPNVFFDAKSVDSARPYYSDGARDDLIQRRYIEAFLGYYADNNEPGFVDLDRASIWAWDARPYPAFPARDDVWSDGGNWARGHWLNGRTGLMPVADVVEELAEASGLHDIDVSGVSGVIPGFIIDRPMSARAALGPLLSLYAIEIAERGGDVVFSMGGGDALKLSPDDVLKGPVKRTRVDAERRVRDVRVTYIDAARDYQTATASARNLSAETVAVADVSVPAVLDEGFARHVARRDLDTLEAGGETLSLALPLTTGLRLQTGDRIDYDGALWVVNELTTGVTVDVTARRDVGPSVAWVSGATPDVPPAPAYAGAPQLLAFDLPGRQGVSVGALLRPFSPVVLSGPSGEVAELSVPLRIGATLSELPARSAALTDFGTTLEIMMESISLSSQTEPSLPFAVETPAGWEVIAARKAVLTGKDRYALSELHRGLDGSDDMIADVPPGARIVWLGAGLDTLDISQDWIGQSVTIDGASSERDARPAELVWQDRARIPLSPVHPHWDGTTVSWIGRDRSFEAWDVDSAHLRFRVRLERGAQTEVIDTSENELVTTPFDRATISQIGPLGRESLGRAVLNLPPG